MRFITSLLLILALVGSPSLALQRYIVGDMASTEASDAAVWVGNRVSLEASGGKIISFYNDKFLTEKAYIDKDGNLSIDGGLELPGDITCESITANTASFTNEVVTGTSSLGAVNIVTSLTIEAGWTAAGQTCADLGQVTTANIDGGTWFGTIDGPWDATGQNCSDLGIVDTIDLDGGTADSLTIGSGTPSSGAFTTVTADSLTAETIVLNGTTAPQIHIDSSGVGEVRIDGDTYANMDLYDGGVQKGTVLYDPSESQMYVGTIAEESLVLGAYNSKYVTIESDGQTEIIGNTVLVSDQQLLGATFPNTTSLEVWNMDSSASEAQVDIVNSKSLSVAAGELESATDVLGNAKFCKWSDGDTYLQSTDAAFNVANTANTDDFMVGSWVYIPDTTPASTVQLFSNSAGANDGWYLNIDATTGQMYGRIDTVADNDTSSYALPSLGGSCWFHVVFARDAGAKTYLFVNGNLVGTGTDDLIGTTQSKFQIGGSNGTTALPQDGTLFDECFFKKGALPTNLDDVVRTIYARSAKKFAVKDGNDNVVIPANVSSGEYIPTYTAVTNIDAISATQKARWIRIGNIVYVTGMVTINPSGATYFAWTASMPFASNVASDADVNGVVSADYNATFGGVVKYSSTTLVHMQSKSAYDGWVDCGYHYSYVIK